MARTGWAIIRTKDSFDKVPLAINEETGEHPRKLPDGRDVWRWSDNETMVDKLIARQQEFRDAKRGPRKPGTTTPARAGKGKA